MDRSCPADRERDRVHERIDNVVNDIQEVKMVHGLWSLVCKA